TRPVQSARTPILNGAAEEPPHPAALRSSATAMLATAREAVLDRIARHPDVVRPCRDLAQAGTDVDAADDPAARGIDVDDLPCDAGRAPAAPRTDRAAVAPATDRDPPEHAAVRGIELDEHVMDRVGDPDRSLAGGDPLGSDRERDDREHAPGARRDLEQAAVERIADRPDGSLPDRKTEERRAPVLRRRGRRHRDDGAVNLPELARAGAEAIHVGTPGRVCDAVTGGHAAGHDGDAVHAAARQRVIAGDVSARCRWAVAADVEQSADDRGCARVADRPEAGLRPGSRLAAAARA